MVMPGRETRHSVAMPPLCASFVEPVAVDDHARFMQWLGHSPPLEQPVGRKYWTGRPFLRIGVGRGLFNVAGTRRQGEVATETSMA